VDLKKFINNQNGQGLVISIWLFIQFLSIAVSTNTETLQLVKRYIVKTGLI
jgi:hypothetical protein